MSLNFFPFEKLPSLFTMMQFSFRMLEFGGFFLVICASIAIGMSINKFNVYTVVCLSCISVLLLLPNLKEIPKGSYYTEYELMQGIPVTSGTGRVHAGCASFEYLPNKAFENREYIETRENVPIILNDNDVGLAKIEDFNKNGTKSTFKIVINDNEADFNSQSETAIKDYSNNNDTIDSSKTNNSLKIELPYIYYIGYNVQYVDENGAIHNVETYESENGFLCINVPNENITVNVKYTGTVIMKIAYIISIVTVLFLIIMYFIKKERFVSKMRKKQCAVQKSNK